MIELRHDLLFRDILEGELRKEMVRGREMPRLEDFPQIIKDMECGTFREGKELAWNRVERKWMIASNQSYDCKRYDNDDVSSFNLF